MTCQWCGDRHGADQLCQRAQRGMTRRSFCFLFGAGIAATVAGPLFKLTGITPIGETLPRVGIDLGKPGGDVTVIAHKIYTGDGRGAYAHIATVPAVGAPLTLHFGEGLRFTADGKEVKPTWIAPSYRRG